MNKIFNAEKEVDDLNIRPSSLNEYIGQEKLKESLAIYIKAAKLRGEVLDHILFYGPPGLGKTTLAMIIANEMGGKIKMTSGPAIEKSKDLIASLSTLEEGDVLFIDEIHRVPKHIEELLYSAMEDYFVDIVIGNDNKSRVIRLNIPPFTLVGATTKAGDLTGPLRDRFGIVSKLNYYNTKELVNIIKRTSKVLNFTLNEEAAIKIAKSSRGTPRIANRLYKRVRDYAMVENKNIIDIEITNKSLEKLNIDKNGLDSIDVILLKNILKNGPIGVKSLAASIGEEQSTIEDVYEPFLLQNGYIKRTSRGRVVTEKAIKYLEES
ncbi:MAG: Holliday junction branch migration DNA helicase RuvB [Bacilli bacterium]|jgi:Holliday junction DNA helicase RuvB|nr:Holliday junction branch migration DNA helicase RuvB [Bacilli bacterium]